MIKSKAKKQSWTKHKDPKGGLTSTAVKAYRRQNPGSKLKTGVTGKADTPEKKMRKGRFLTRFYGQNPLPPLKKPSGKPTRLALAINRWKENPPKTQEAAERGAVKSVSQARKLAAKGRNLIETAKKARKKK
jgi:hypothetical protein